MSSAGYAKPLSIELTPSRLLAGAVVGLFGGALLMIPLLPVSGWLVALLMLIVVISCVHALAGPVLMLWGEAIVTVEWRADGSWWLRTRDGEEREARLLADSYVHPWLTVLNFRVLRSMRFAGSPHPASMASVLGRFQWLRATLRFVCGRRCSVVLLPDSVGRECLRQLRVRLRLEGAAAAGSGFQ